MSTEYFLFANKLKYVLKVFYLIFQNDLWNISILVLFLQGLLWTKKYFIMNVGFFLIAYLTVSCISEHEFNLFLYLSFQMDKSIKTSVFIKEQVPLEYNTS